MFLHNTLIYNVKSDLSINNGNIEALCIEIVNKNGKNIVINTRYRNLQEYIPNLKSIRKISHFTNKAKNNGKDLHVVRDLNLNLLDHSTSSKLKDYLRIVFQNLLILMTNQPTRVSKSSATIIDHILTNSYF